MPKALATYRIYVDWDNDGGLSIGDFETGLDGWSATGSAVPELATDSTRVHSGTRSLLIPWVIYNPMQFNVSGTGFDQGTFGGPGLPETPVAFTFGEADQGFDDGRFANSQFDDPEVQTPRVEKEFIGLIPGREYTFTGWSYVPAGSLPVKFGVTGIGASDPTTTYEAWEEVSYTFTATADRHTLRILPDGAPVGDQPTWADELMLLGPGEDVSRHTLGLRQALSFKYGRDTARGLSPVAPGETALKLNNRGREYSPDNPGSPIAGYLGPAKPLLIKALYADRSHVMFRGYLDDYEIIPEPSERAVDLSALDLLGSKLGEATLSTALYPSLQTGQALHVVLDAIGWPADARDIDTGATTLRYWWEEGTTATEAIQRLMAAEGPPSLVSVDSKGWIVFRDRHHRLLRPQSLEVQATFRASGFEPTFSAPMEYDIGWKDLVNSVEVSVDERQAAAEYTPVFETEDVIAVSAGETRTLAIEGQDPFTGALIPVEGVDYVLQGGDLEVTLSRTSGQSAEVYLKSETGAVVTGMKVRAFAVSVARTWKVLVEDKASISANGLKSFTSEIPLVNVHDAAAIGAILVGQRSERLPVVTLDVNNGNAARMAQVLGRDLSDRVHVVESETFTDHPFYIEQIEHNVEQIGHSHVATFGMERAREQVTPVFTFDDPDAGFDDGLFGLAGFDQPQQVFVLDQSNLDEGLLGH
jgi:hypothetical protein